MKKTIVCGSLLAVFLMMMIPNISAVEYQTVKEIYEEKNDDVQSILGFLLNKIDMLPSISNFIVILTAFLQGLFMFVVYLLSTLALDNIDNVLIGLIVFYMTTIPTAFILHKWDEFLINNYELTQIQERIIEVGEYVFYFIFYIIYEFVIGNDNFIEKHFD